MTGPYFRYEREKEITKGVYSGAQEWILKSGEFNSRLEMTKVCNVEGATV